MVKILVVEDEVNDAELALRCLRKAGMECDGVRVETEALFCRWLVELQPDIILSDFSMPFFDGMSALFITRQLAPETPFIFLSGTMGEEHAIRALKSGATDYVLKNDLPRLAPAVERALTDAGQLREQRRVEAALHRSEQRFRLAASTGDVWDWTVSTGESYIPHQWKLRHGFSDDELPNRWETWSTLLHPDDGAVVERALQEHMDTGRVYDVEFRTRDHLGGYRWSHAKGQSLRDPAGNFVYMAGSIVDITERKHAEFKVQRLNRVYALHSGIGSLIVRAQSRDELFREACRIAVELGGFKHAWVALSGSGSDDLGPAGQEAPADDLPPRQLEVLHQAVLAQWLAADSTTVQALFTIVAFEEPTLSPFRAVAMLPLTVESRLAGLLVLHAGEPDLFDSEERRLLAEMVNDLSFALDHIDKAERLNHLAYYDALTGLANRSLFMERVNQYVETARREQHKLAVLALNVDRFKTVNDSLGHAAGDELLKQIARRLIDRATDTGWYARIDADNFAVVIPEVHSEEALARTIEQKTASCLGSPFLVAGAELRLSARAGIAVFPSDGSHADELYRHARAAADKAKVGGERYLFYTQQMSDKIAGALAMESRLRRAIEREEFVLHYQPKVDACSRRMLGLEALILWQDPVQGLVPPTHFFPLMEETGLIAQAGAWAMQQAVKDRERWRRMGVGEVPRVAVNVSAHQLRRGDFVQSVRRALELDTAPPGLDLEITESLVMGDIETNIGRLEQLRELGVNIAVDNFGTGYSSLRYLAQLPVQTLKIDRSFVCDMLEDDATMTLVSAVVTLAHSLRLKVVAEGVETETQARRLRELGCDEMQGDLFSQPLPFDRMTDLLTHAMEAAR